MATATKKTTGTKTPKKAVKAVTKSSVVKSSVKVVESKEDKVEKSTSLSISVLDVDGKVSGKMSLPESLFGAKVNKALFI